MDWKNWHDKYDDPNQDFAARLETVRARIRAALDTAPAGPLRALSLCAGQGRDLIPVLAAHPRGHEVAARLVELDQDLAEDARRAAAEAGLAGVEVVTGDAALTDHYLDFAPADLVLVCGLYGNIALADIERTVAACAALCAEGGAVVWTRGRRPGSETVPQICAWYEQRGFERLWLAEPGIQLCVGAHRQVAAPEQLPAGQRLFEFIGYDVLNAGR
jgi:SAM-dependent methyltransferase